MLKYDHLISVIDSTIQLEQQQFGFVSNSERLVGTLFNESIFLLLCMKEGEFACSTGTFDDATCSNRTQMTKVMLTVCKKNPDAHKFFLSTLKWVESIIASKLYIFLVTFPPKPF